MDGVALLPGRLDGMRVVMLPYEGNGLFWWQPIDDGEAGQGRPKSFCGRRNRRSPRVLSCRDMAKVCGVLGGRSAVLEWEWNAVPTHPPGSLSEVPCYQLAGIRWTCQAEIMKQMPPGPQLLPVGSAEVCSRPREWARSNTWSVVGGKKTDEVYLAAREAMAAAKVSMHSSGRWRWAMTEQEAARRQLGPDDDRVMWRWVRLTPIGPGWTHAAKIVIPSSSIRRLGQEKAPKEGVISYWQVDPGPREVWFDVFIQEPGAPEITLHNVAEPIGRIELPTGAAYWLVMVTLPARIWSASCGDSTLFSTTCCAAANLPITCSATCFAASSSPTATSSSSRRPHLVLASTQGRPSTAKPYRQATLSSLPRYIAPKTTMTSRARTATDSLPGGMRTL